jgi:hypothetical protein
MPSELPGFLQEFIKHRQTQVKNAPTPVQVKKAALTSVTKTKELELDVKGIIDKKPPRKVVDEYLQMRCDELSKEKMK